MKTVYITARSELHQQHALNSAPAELDIVMLRQPERSILFEHLHDAAYLISERSGVIDAEMIAAASHLKLILRLGSMTHDIDLQAAKTAGVQVAYWPDMGVISVAEHVVLQMLMLLKKLNEAQRIVWEASPEWRESRRTDENTFAYNWSKRAGLKQLSGSTVGIVGFGEIAAELARRLHGWNCTLLYNKRNKLPDTVERELDLTYSDKDKLYQQSDIVVNLLPYSSDTDQSINSEVFNLMKQDAVLVSVGSGSVIDEAALAKAIRSGKLAGAALDTYEYEPVRPDNPLLQLVNDGYNVVLTPHIAAGNQGKDRSAEYSNIIRHLNGEPLYYRII